MTLDESTTENDVIDEVYGVKMATENKLSSYLEGAVVDYMETSYGGGFEIRTAKSGADCASSCSSGGCGH